MPTTFLVTTDPKELFLLFDISSALLPELRSPAELDWSFSLSLLLIFSQLLWVLSSPSPSVLCLPLVSLSALLSCCDSVTVHCCEGSPLMVASYTLGSMENKIRSRFLVLYIILS